MKSHKIPLVTLRSHLRPQHPHLGQQHRGPHRLIQARGQLPRRVAGRGSRPGGGDPVGSRPNATKNGEVMGEL